MHLRTTVAAITLAAACSLSVASTARADNASNAAAAQSLYDEARRLMQAGKYQDACPKLEASQRLDPGPGTQFHLADCYDHVGRTASAWALFLEVAAAAKSKGKDEQEKIARDRAEALAGKLSHVTVVVPDTSRVQGLTIKRGDIEVAPDTWGTPLAVDPGKVEFTISAPGRRTANITIELGPNHDEKTVHIPPLDTEDGAAPPPPEPETKAGGTMSASSQDMGGGGSGMKIASYAALGVGVVGVAAGVFFGLQSKSKTKDADALFQECSQVRCTTSDPRSKQIDDLDSQANTAGALSVTGFVVGGVGIAAGVTLFILSNSSSSSGEAHAGANRRITPWLGLNSAGVSGSF